MNFRTIPYADYEKNFPQEGRHILAQQTSDHILVYQAYRNSIADYAIEHQRFGGSDYSYNRMSWIKPNFLWMMYRSGWGAKLGQQRILGIWISKSDFEIILANSTMTSFAQSPITSEIEWKKSLEEKPIRLQWDPDHLPNGEKHTRKAIQLGIKGDLLKSFGTEMIVKIEDLSEFVHTQAPKAKEAPYDSLKVAAETVFIPSSQSTGYQIGLNQKQLTKIEI